MTRIFSDQPAPPTERSVPTCGLEAQPLTAAGSQVHHVQLRGVRPDDVILAWHPDGYQRLDVSTRQELPGYDLLTRLQRGLD